MSRHQAVKGKPTVQAPLTAAVSSWLVNIKIGDIDMDKKTYEEAREQLISIGAEELADAILRINTRLSEDINKANNEDYILGIVQALNTINAEVQATVLRYSLAKGYQKAVKNTKGAKNED